MKKAAVVIDDWKLPTFKKHLEAAGYSYSVHPGVTQDSLILQVNYERVRELKPIIEAASAECIKAPGIMGFLSSMMHGGFAKSGYGSVRGGKARAGRSRRMDHGPGKKLARRIRSMAR